MPHWSLAHCSCVLSVDSQPDTQELDRSEIRTRILLTTASSDLKGRQSFTHMLTEVRASIVGQACWVYCVPQV